MHILASGEDELVKLLIAGIVGAFWLISQIASKVLKNPDKLRPPSRPKQEPELGERWQRELPPVRVGRPGGPMLEELPPMRVPSQRPPTKRPPRLNRPEPAVQRRVMPAAQPATPSPTPKPPLPRREFLEALLQPRNLKKAYVLNEILQPPVSMRE